MTDYIADARKKTSNKITALQSKLDEAQERLGNKGCVFATGSFGRLEAGPDSDLDLFIVIKTYERDANGKRETLFHLKETEQIRLKNDIIVAADEVGISEFDSGGKYLKSHRFEDFTERLGSQEDDYLNTFTGRLLLLLESKSLLGHRAYDKLVAEVIKAYFTDFAGNEDRFVPAFLFNDILRIWRTFCVNYEFFRKNGGGDWRIKNLKLKYIRIVTCFSAIVYLLATFTVRKTVTPDDVETMVALTPTERLSAVAGGDFSSLENADQVSSLLTKILAEYSSFLELNHLKKEEAQESFEAHEDEWRARSHEFGGNFANIMKAIAGGDGFANPLYRVTSV